MAYMDRYVSSNSRLSPRFKQFIVLVLAVIFGMLLSVSLNAQHLFRKSKSSHKSKFRPELYEHEACLLNKKSKAQKYKSIYRLVNNYKTLRKPATAKVEPSASSQSTRAFASRECTPINIGAYASRKTHSEAIVITAGLTPADIKRSTIIEEIVSENLRNSKENSPIELAPLYFNQHKNEFSVVDVNPFLFAVEFARQGKTIVLENSKGDHQSSPALLETLEQLMHQMGVPKERISVTYQDVELMASKSTVVYSSKQRVDLKAI